VEVGVDGREDVSGASRGLLEDTSTVMLNTNDRVEPVRAIRVGKRLPLVLLVLSYPVGSGGAEAGHTVGHRLQVRLDLQFLGDVLTERGEAVVLMALVLRPGAPG